MFHCRKLGFLAGMTLDTIITGHVFKASCYTYLYHNINTPCAIQLNPQKVKLSRKLHNTVTTFDACKRVAYPFSICKQMEG